MTSWLGNGPEDGTPRDGLLSSRPEWHAAAIGSFFGIVAGLTQSPEVALFAFLVFTGKAKVSNGHLRDAAEEVAYSGGAFGVLFVLTTVAGTL